MHKNRKIDEVDETTTETDRQVETDTKKEKNTSRNIINQQQLD